MAARTHLLAGLAALALLCAPLSARAANVTATTPLTLNSTTYQDLGTAPVQVSTKNNPVSVIVSDMQPTTGALGSILMNGQALVPFYAIDAGSHVWAAMPAAGLSAGIAYAPITTPGGSGGSTTANQGAAAAITGGWPITDGAGADTTGTLTSGAGSVSAPIDGYASAKIQIKGTYAAFTVNTLASSDGGTTTVPLQCAMSDGSQIGTAFTLTANQSVEIACGHLSGDDTLVLSTSAGPATGTANIDVSPASFPSMDGTTVKVVGGGTPLSPSSVVPTPTNIAGAYSAATIGMADSTPVAAGVAKFFLDLVNLSPSATVCINFGATATISGTTCAAGEITLPPLWHRSWEGNFVPADAIHAIASAASTPASYGAK